MKLDAFTQAYIECALWSSTDESDDQGGEPLDQNYGVSDIAPASLAQMRQDCQEFQERFGELLEQCGHPLDYAGHDLWLSRSGHGAGFFDRGLGNTGDALQDAAHSMGERNLYVGDDGLIYQTQG